MTHVELEIQDEGANGAKLGEVYTVLYIYSIPYLQENVSIVIY